MDPPPSRVCCLADAFAISCGTATFDTVLEDLPTLLIRWRKSGEYFLPKGRKDKHETLQQAAERETFEETGFAAKILPARFETLATGRPDDNRKLSEPIAMTQRTANGVTKVIFWFVASADSRAMQAKDTQQDDEDFETFWLPFEEAMAKLTWPDDRSVLEFAAKVVKTEINGWCELPGCVLPEDLLS